MSAISCFEENDLVDIFMQTYTPLITSVLGPGTYSLDDWKNAFGLYCSFSGNVGYQIL